MEPFFPLSRYVVHACGFTKGFKVILTKYAVIVWSIFSLNDIVVVVS